MVIAQIKSLIDRKRLSIDIRWQDQREIEYLQKYPDEKRMLAAVANLLDKLGQYPPQGCDPAGYMICVLQEAASIAKSNHFLFIELVEMAFTQNLLQLVYQGVCRKILEESRKFFNPAIQHHDVSRILKVYGSALSAGYDMQSRTPLYLDVIQNYAGILRNFTFGAMLGNGLYHKLILPKDAVMLTQWAYTDRCLIEQLPWGWNENIDSQAQSHSPYRFHKFPENYQGICQYISQCYNLGTWIDAYHKQMRQAQPYPSCIFSFQGLQFPKIPIPSYEAINIPVVQVSSCFMSEMAYEQLQEMLILTREERGDMQSCFQGDSNEHQSTGGVVLLDTTKISKKLAGGVVSLCFVRKIVIYRLAYKLDPAGVQSLYRILDSQHFADLSPQVQILVLSGLANLRNQHGRSVQEVAFLVNDPEFVAMNSETRSDIFQLVTLGAQGWWLACSFRKNNSTDFKAVTTHLHKATTRDIKTINVIFPGQRCQSGSGELANAVKMARHIKANFPEAEIRLILLESVPQLPQIRNLLGHWPNYPGKWRYAIDYIDSFFPGLKGESLEKLKKKGGIVETDGFKIVNGIFSENVNRYQMNEQAARCITEADVTITASMAQIIDKKSVSTEIKGIPKSRVGFYITQQNALEFWISAVPQDSTPTMTDGKIEKFYSPDLATSGHYENVDDLTRLVEEYTPKRTSFKNQEILQRRQELLDKIVMSRKLSPTERDAIIKSHWSVVYIQGAEGAMGEACFNAYVKALEAQAHEMAKNGQESTVFMVVPKVKETSQRDVWEKLKSRLSRFSWEDLRPEKQGASGQGDPQFPKLKILVLPEQKHDLFCRMVAGTEGVNLGTGSNCVIEMAAAGKMFLYEPYWHKLPLIEAYVELARNVLKNRGYTTEEIETFTQIFSPRNTNALLVMAENQRSSLMCEFQQFHNKYLGKDLPQNKFIPEQWSTMVLNQVHYITETICRAHEAYTGHPMEANQIGDILVKWYAYSLFREETTKLNSDPIDPKPAQAAFRLFSDMPKARKMFEIVDRELAKKNFVSKLVDDIVWENHVQSLAEELGKMGPEAKAALQRVIKSAPQWIRDSLNSVLSNNVTLQKIEEATKVFNDKRFHNWLQRKQYLQNVAFATPRLLIAMVTLYLMEQFADMAGLKNDNAGGIESTLQSFIRMGVVIPSAMLAQRGVEKLWESLERKLMVSGMSVSPTSIPGTRVEGLVRGIGSFMTGIARGSIAQAVTMRVMEEIGIDPGSQAFQLIAFSSFFLPDIGRILMTPWVAGLATREVPMLKGVQVIAGKGLEAMNHLGKLGSWGSKGVRAVGVFGGQAVKRLACLGPIAVIGYAKLLDDVVGGIWSLVDVDADFNKAVGVLARKLKHQAIKDESGWIIRALLTTADAIALTVTPNMCAAIERDDWKTVARNALKDASEKGDSRGCMEILVLLAKQVSDGALSGGEANQSVDKPRYILELEAFFASSVGRDIMGLLDFTKGPGRINHESKLLEVIDSRTGRVKSQAALIRYLKAQENSITTEITRLKNAIEQLMQSLSTQQSADMGEIQTHIDYFCKSWLYYATVKLGIEDAKSWQPEVAQGKVEADVRDFVSYRDHWLSTDEESLAYDFRGFMNTPDEKVRAMYARSIINALERLGSNGDDVAVEWIKLGGDDAPNIVKALTLFPPHLLDRLELELTSGVPDYHEAILVRIAQVKTGHRESPQVAEMISQMGAGDIDDMADEIKVVFVVDEQIGHAVLSWFMAETQGIKRAELALNVYELLDINKLSTLVLLELYRGMEEGRREEHHATRNILRPIIASQLLANPILLERETLDIALAKTIVETVNLVELARTKRDIAYRLMRTLEGNSKTKDLANRVSSALNWGEVKQKAEVYLTKHEKFWGLTTDVANLAKDIAGIIKNTKDNTIREEASDTLIAILDRLQISDDNLVREILDILNDTQLSAMVSRLLTRMYESAVSGIKDSAQAYRLQLLRFDRNLATVNDLARDLKDAYGTGDKAAQEILRLLNADAAKYGGVVLAYFDAAGNADDSATIAIMGKIQQGNTLDFSKIDGRISMRMYQSLTTGWRNENEVKQFRKPFVEMFMAALRNNKDTASREMIRFLNGLGDRDDDVVRDLLAELNESQLEELPEDLVQRMYRASSTGWRDDTQCASLQLLMFRKGWGDQETLAKDIISKYTGASGLDEVAIAEELILILDRDPQVFGSVVDNVLLKLASSNNDDDVALEIARRITQGTLSMMPAFLREHMVKSLSSGWDTKDEKRAAQAIENLCATCEADEYIRYDRERDMADLDYPKRIKGAWPGLWDSGIDAAVQWSGKAYFFKGSEYIRFDIASNRADSGYPQRIKDGWPGLWKNGIDAAVNWGNGKLYFFKGKEYIRFDIASDKTDSGYPQRIKNGWPGIWEKDIDAAVNWGNGKVYFFKGSEYLRFDIASNSVDKGASSIVSGWPGINVQRVRAAIVWNERYAYFFGG